MRHVIFSLRTVRELEIPLTVEELRLSLFCLPCCEKDFLAYLGPAVERREPAPEYNLSMHARVAKMDGRLVCVGGLSPEQTEDVLNGMLKEAKLEPVGSSVFWDGGDIVFAVQQLNEGRIQVIADPYRIIL